MKRPGRQDPEHADRWEMADMERADWLDGALESEQARFLMITAITHHRFSSPMWGEHEVRKLYTELAEIDSSAERLVTALRCTAP